MWKNQVFVIGIIVSLSPNIFAEPPLVGRWIEDESLRTGLYDFLWARGKFEKKKTRTILYYESSRFPKQKSFSHFSEVIKDFF